MGHGPGVPSTVEIRLLGEPDVVIDGRPVGIATGKQQALLVALAIDHRTPRSVEHLVQVLWESAPPPSAAATVRTLVSRLRQALAADVEPCPLTRRGGGYVLDLPTGRVDADRFEALAATGRAALAGGAPADALADLSSALALWQGRALGAVADLPFARPLARRLDDARVDAVEDAADAELALGRPHDAVTRLEPHVYAHPLRERAGASLMLALYRTGRQADALAAYRRLRDALADELGIYPTAALRQLETAILQQRASLQLSAPDPSTPTRPCEFGDTVAFLFTDIESSTRSWESDPDVMSKALAGHDQALADACMRWGGTVFSHTGDGMCAAFPTAAGAIGAAVAAQQAVAKPRAALRVRMGVHAGTVERRAGNFFGPTLNRTARLMATAWGGQVVCSTVAAELATDRLPDGVGLRELGAVALSDLARSERVYQVIHPSLAADFPPLRAGGGSRTNLPTAPTSFIGRDTEVAEVLAALGRARLVTIAGPGGAGKTRLTCSVAAQVADGFDDGVWLVDLTPLRDPALVVTQVAAAMSLDTASLAAGGRPLLEGLTEALLHRRTLIVLDNCEHHVEAVADLAHALLVGAPDVVLLATSREILDVAGESVIRLGGLRLPSTTDLTVDQVLASEAVALFCARAAESAPGFAPTEANLEAVVRVCRALDGIPLALELAAARVRLLGAAQLASRLDGLSLVGPRTADPRHRTLTAAIAWSHDLLAEAERVVLRRLSVFPTPWMLSSAEAVVAKGPDGLDGPPPSEVLDLVGRLVDKSLVLSVAGDGEEPRYRLLETLRQYAAGRLAEAGETDAVHARLRDFLQARCLGWATRTVDARWLRWIAGEIDSIRTVLTWADSQGDAAAVLRLSAPLFSYWQFCGSMVEGIPVMERATRVPAELDPVAAVWVRVGLAEFLAHLGGEDARREALMREALVLAESGSDTFTLAVTQFLFGQQLIGQGERDEALRVLDRSVESFRPLGSPVAPNIYLAQVLAALFRGAEATALGRLRDAVGPALAAPDNMLGNILLGLHAVVEAAGGDAAAARRSAEAAVAAARTSGMQQTLVMTLVRAVESALLTSEPPPPIDLLDELLGLLHRLGMRIWVGESLELAGILLLRSLDPESAATVFGAAAARRLELHEGDAALPPLAAMTATTDAAITTALDEETDATARRRGAALNLQQSLNFARAALARLGGPVPE